MRSRNGWTFLIGSFLPRKQGPSITANEAHMLAMCPRIRLYGKGKDSRVLSAMLGSKTLSRASQLKSAKNELSKESTPTQSSVSIKEKQQLSTLPWDDTVRRVLQQTFQNDHFRPLQKDAIDAALSKHDVFVSMATGHGKSLCFQMPALIEDGVTLVVSPLISLIEDQVRALKALNIHAAALCGSTKKAEVDEIIQDLKSGDPKIKLLYTTPERIQKSKTFMPVLKKLWKAGKLSRLVFDEAHCISEWGHDFRPDYLKLRKLREVFKDVPIMCVTASSTAEVREDIQRVLNVKEFTMVQTTYNRENIYYEVLKKKSREQMTEEIATMIKAYENASGLVYCLTTRECDQLAEALSARGIAAEAYHAKIGHKERTKQQRDWMWGTSQVLCTTTAFGMGIDKADIRFIIHSSIPGSIEALYQQTGRAGRDGEDAYSAVFFSRTDANRVGIIYGTVSSATKAKMLDDVIDFCTTKSCRRQKLLEYFGEILHPRVCTGCDVCEKAAENSTSTGKQAASTPTSVKPLNSKDEAWYSASSDDYDYEDLSATIHTLQQVCRDDRKLLVSKPTLHRIATVKPTTLEELASIKGVGKKRALALEDKVLRLFA